VALASAGGGRAATQELLSTAPVIQRARMKGHEVPSILDLAHDRELFGHQVNGYRTDEVEGGPRLAIEVDAVADPPMMDMDALRAEIETAVNERGDEDWEVVVAGRARRTMLAYLEAPALGWATAHLVEEVAETSSPVQVVERTLDNGLLRIDVDDRGELTMTAGSVTTAGVGRLVDGGDAGDSYNYAPPASDRLISDPDRVEVRAVAAGPLLGSLEITRTYGWPASTDLQARSTAHRSVDVITTVELRVGEPFARVRVAFDNPCHDQRVRYHIPLPAPVTSSFAEGQFAVVERGLEAEGGHGEHPLPTLPAHGMVAVDGLSVLLGHVVEYELVDDGRELALTMLRSTGMISRNDNPLRREPAGPEVAIPDAQCPGPIELSFGLYLHRGSWEEAGSLLHQECFAHPFAVAPGTAEPTPTSIRREGLKLSGPNVALTSLRRRGDGIEVRLVCEQSKPGTARLRGDFKRAAKTDLLGKDVEPIAVDEGSLELALAPWEIATLRLTP
ncbi:MAG: alpha-mannosidase, partial [Actinomycetota bacterium]